MLYELTDQVGEHLVDAIWYDPRFDRVVLSPSEGKVFRIELYEKHGRVHTGLWFNDTPVPSLLESRTAIELLNGHCSDVYGPMINHFRERRRAHREQLGRAWA
ncbi:MAG: hypothetical protein AAGI11_04420 [Pseudomonadota bacterium]